MILYLIAFLVCSAGFLAGDRVAQWCEQDRREQDKQKAFWAGFDNGVEVGMKRGMELAVSSMAESEHPNLKSLQAQRRGIVERLN